MAEMKEDAYKVMLKAKRAWNRHKKLSKRKQGLLNQLTLRDNGVDTGLKYHLWLHSKEVRVVIDIKANTVIQIMRWMNFQNLLSEQKPEVRLLAYINTLIRGEAENLKKDMLMLNKVVRARYKKIDMSRYINREL